MNGAREREPIDEEELVESDSQGRTDQQEAPFAGGKARSFSPRPFETQEPEQPEEQGGPAYTQEHQSPDVYGSKGQPSRRSKATKEELDG